MQLSLEKGEAITRLPPIDTVAGGIEGGIGANAFSYVQKTIDQVVLLTESEIRQGVIWMLDHHHYLIEPSSAAALAALCFGKIESLESPTVVVITGRNIAFPTLKSIMESEGSNN